MSDELKFSTAVLFLALHVPLLLIFRAVPLTAKVYSLAILVAGLHFLVNDNKPNRVMWAIAYLTGAEILWRGAEAALVWEYGKYAVLLLCCLVVLKYRLGKSFSFWPILFIALLIPGIFIVPGFDREAVSYQLAGPVTLALVSLVCSTIEFRKADLQRFFLAMIAPTVAMGFLVLVMLLTQNVSFYGSGENEAITGGIGANQVTSALSLGSTAAFFLVFLVSKDRNLRTLMVLVALALVGLSVLTFARSGLWNTVGAVAAGILFLAFDRRQFLKTFAVLVLIGLLVYFVGFPWIDHLTEGAVIVRFQDIDSTGRDVLLRIDTELFRENPVWGVGVGQSPQYHIPAFGYPKPTHTEYGRLLAEHGSFGAAAIFLLASVTLYRIFSRRPSLSKAIAVAFTVWALLYMTHSATRMVAPSLAFGLAAATFLVGEEKDA